MFNKTLIITLTITFCSNLYGSDFFKLPAGPKYIGMGNTGTAICDDNNSVFWNPAGLNYIESMQFGTIQNLLIQDITSQWGSVIFPTKNTITGIFFNYLAIPEFQGYDNTGAKTELIKVTDSLIGLTCGFKIIPETLFTGFNIKLARQNMHYINVNNIMFDLGFLYSGILINNRPVKLGINIQNIGQNITYDLESEQLPLTIRFGTGYSSYFNDISAAIGADIVSQINDNNTYLATGMEFGLADFIFFRFGCNTNKKTVSSMNYGIGLKFSGIYFDYSISGINAEPGNTHNIGITYKFPVKTDKYIKQINSYKNRGYLLNALNCLYKTREINPEYKEIDSIFEEINSTLEEISLKSQDLSPKEIFCVKGFVYFNKNELNSAVDEWEKAVKLNNRPISNEKLALSNKILNAYIIKTKRNIRLLEEKRKTDELLQIGADLFLKKDYEKAMKFFNQALKSDKENTSAKEYIEKCKIELKKLNSSRKQQDKQERLKTSQAGNDIKTADSHYQQGLIYYASGQLELAKKEWEIALKYNPDNERIKSALSKIQKELK